MEENSRVRVFVISIHALHEESDPDAPWCPTSTPFQSTLSMRRATDGRRNRYHDHWISIHALHEESDLHVAVKFTNLRLRISIHALHEESDVYDSSGVSRKSLFQSTLSMRRATRHTDGHRN